MSDTLIMKCFILLALFTLSATAGIHVKNFWKNYEVTVCFGAGESEDRREGRYVLKVRNWKESQKAKVRHWVQEEFTLDKTGIHFTGFLDCNEMPDADVVIFHNKTNQLVSSVFGGLYGLAKSGPRPGEVQGYPLASGFVSISTSGMDKGTVIHEFGHSAGLAHEHIHPDAFLLDKNYCPLLKEGQGYNGRYFYGEYDPDSVMNYCALQRAGGNKIGLSKKDVEMLRTMYP